jgi:hypothetical protein
LLTSGASDRRLLDWYRSTIGAWQNCFEFLSFASVFTNCFLLALVSSHIGSIIPLSNQEFLETDWGRYNP